MEELLRRLENAPTLQEKQQIAQQLLAFDSAPKLRGIYFDGDNWGDLYFLWSLERMAVIYDLKLIEGKDWYEWGAEIILANQQADGGWRERFPNLSMSSRFPSERIVERCCRSGCCRSSWPPSRRRHGPPGRTAIGRSEAPSTAACINGRARMSRCGPESADGIDSGWKGSGLDAGTP